ncbi:MAG: outer membrane lipoprotein-sorting protein [Bacteroidetes bacterium]|nr:outer membrane lipoprotein-sorting protein [Bacteroidota bacterium]
MRLISLVITVLLLGASVSGQEDDAASIIERSREKTMTDRLNAVVTLTITDRNGATRVRINSIVSKKYGDGTEKRFLRFQSPAEVQGTTILIHDYRDRQDDMWIYLPALKRVRRIVSSDKGKSFMGSEFTNADISSPPAADFVNRHAGGSGESGLWIIESLPATPVLETDYGYSRRVSTFEKNTLQLRKMDFFDRSGNMIKTIEVLSVEQIGNGGNYIISEMRASNLINGRLSVMKMDGIVTSGTVNDTLFDPANIDK